MLHRVAFEEKLYASFTVEDEDNGQGVNWHHDRVVQAIGELAWSSHIWVEKA